MSSKYVPPQLRKAPVESSSNDRREPERSSTRSFGQEAGASAGPTPAPSSGQRETVAAPTNSRWKSLDEPAPSASSAPSYPDRGVYQDRGAYQDRDRGSYQDRDRGSYQDRDRGSYQDRDRAPRGSFFDRPRSGPGERTYSGGGGYSSGTNSLGFHGDERPNARLENELFHSGDSQTAGINFDKYDDIPVEVSAVGLEPCTEFSIETVGPKLLNNLSLINYTKPTPVQKYSIPIGLSGGDMMACAQTGSGKTAGFLFPVISVMLRLGALPEPDRERGRNRTTFPTALVLAPTRELASQIFDEAQKFCYSTGIRPVVIYGGTNFDNQKRELQRGADILVATPGRLVDLIERGWIRLDCIRFLVLDEADRMLDMGFEPQIRRIVQEEGMPADRQTFMFSATFPAEIQRLASDFMKDYTFLAVGRVGAASRDVSQRVVWVEQADKCDFVIDFLSRVPEGLILIFVETKRGCDILEEILYQKGFPTSSIHGDKSQREREDALKLFKSGRTPILVATDVAARGLDIPNVTQVINFDLPTQIDDYVHRIGRTGRVGNVGSALSLVNEKNRNIAKDLTELLIENEQECPEWLERFSGYGSRNSSRGGGGRGRGGSHGGRFGAKDYRRPDSSSGSKGGFAPRSSGPPSSYNSGGHSRYDSGSGSGGASHDTSAW